eukprot:CAMPEP_0116875406 /NCGR_PEP_ID=MMETSP0463-20121206/7346_1 /TAXON_ID=181622 /ORGANISM="Strombidinopsis sp, Strain SopsisLIS2011" /LENGTH=102 /DNA_ID=CAMNT_0004520975 /DNA_START=961 /DNA_END=1269 /DNA_ORIENTATION=+
MSELKETDAIGVDLENASKINNEIIKEVLNIYFNVLKHQNDSPLLKSVFLGLPQFTQYVNLEIVFDLIHVMREYFKFEMDMHGTQDKGKSVSNVLAGLLCVF